jgi:hypothetical protein
MKNWMTFAFTWGTIALLFSDSVKAEQPEMDGVCSVLNALTPEAKAVRIISLLKIPKIFIF